MNALVALLDFYSFLVVVAVALSWLGLSLGNPVVRLVRALTEPVLSRVRGVVPALAGLDLSPALVLLGLRVVRSFLLRF